MSNNPFRRAQRYHKKLRLAFVGGPGSGKSYTALSVSCHMAHVLFGQSEGKVAVIDTERGSGDVYADTPCACSQCREQGLSLVYDHLPLTKFDISNYIRAMDAAAANRYPILLIDSITHAWTWLTEEIERIAQNTFGGNKWAAWSRGTPLQNRFVEAILDYPGHLIVTMRSQTEWALEEDERGKKKPVEIGTKAVQRKGVSYEFDIVAQMRDAGTAAIGKTRCSNLREKILQFPGQDLAQTLLSWLNSGAQEAPQAPVLDPGPSETQGSSPAPSGPLNLDSLTAGGAEVHQDHARSAEALTAASGTQGMNPEVQPVREASPPPTVPEMPKPSDTPSDLSVSFDDAQESQDPIIEGIERVFNGFGVPNNAARGVLIQALGGGNETEADKALRDPAAPDCLAKWCEEHPEAWITVPALPNGVYWAHALKMTLQTATKDTDARAKYVKEICGNEVFTKNGTMDAGRITFFHYWRLRRRLQRDHLLHASVKVLVGEHPLPPVSFFGL